MGWWTWLKQKTSPIGEKLHCSGKILCNATHDFDVLGILINGSCSHWNNDDDDDGDDNVNDHDDDGDSNVDEDDLFLIFARLGHSWHPDEWKLLLEQRDEIKQRRNMMLMKWVSWLQLCVFCYSCISGDHRLLDSVINAITIVMSHKMMTMMSSIWSRWWWWWFWWNDDDDDDGDAVAIWTSGRYHDSAAAALFSLSQRSSW